MVFTNWQGSRYSIPRGMLYCFSLSQNFFFGRFSSSSPPLRLSEGTPLPPVLCDAFGLQGRFIVMQGLELECD